MLPKQRGHVERLRLLPGKVPRDGEVVSSREIPGPNGGRGPRRIGGGVDAVVGCAPEGRKVEGPYRHQLAAVVVSHHTAQPAQRAGGGHDLAVLRKHDLRAGSALSLPTRLEQLGKRRWALIRDDDGLTGEAIPAVVIATEHPERQRSGSGQGVEERLLLDRIEL